MKKSELIAFRGHILSFMIYLFLTIFWTLNEFGTVTLPRPLFYAVVTIAQTSLSFAAFCFAAYTLIRFGLPVARSAKFNLILILPFLVVFVLFIVSLFTGVMFTITPENVFRPGKVYFMLGICSMIYFALIIGVAIKRVFTSKSISARKDATTMVVT